MARLIIASLLLVGLFACNQQPKHPPLTEATNHLKNQSLKPFYHGVASGDPLAESVILWTRVTPETSLPEIKVTWEIAEDQQFSKIANSGTLTTSPEKDYTVKLEATQLKPGTRYYYRFKALEATSMTGTTLTAPTTSNEVKFAAVSCSNYEWGYFNAYAALADEPNLNAILHLGDYIYEYGPGVYGDTSIGRINVPAYEIISLDDYHTRYAQYRLDPDLQAVHAAHPFITIWDDHEITNNAYQTGAQNHQDDEGDYQTRSASARQAYYEWLPIREDQEHYRKFAFGELADLIMLDERLAGRTEQLSKIDDLSLNNTEHTMLGQKQLEWFTQNLKGSQAQWKVIGNQVIYSYLNWGRSRFTLNLDAWDGYPVEQQKIADLIQSNAINNIVFLTGDTHSSWAFEATNKPFDNYNPQTGEGAFAVEFGVTSINSGNSNERNHTDSVIVHEQKITNTPLNPHLKYANLRDHGYLVLTLTPEKARVDYKYIETVRERNKKVSIGKSFEVKTGTVKLQEVE